MISPLSFTDLPSVVYTLSKNNAANRINLSKISLNDQGTDTTRSKAKATRITSAIQAEQDVYFELCTDTRLEDELLNQLLSSKKNGRFYYAQAEFFQKRINIYRPVPIFVIHSKDISIPLAKELDSLGERMKKRIIVNAVRRIYESIDPYYFHTSGIYGKIKCHIMEDETEL